nr:ankyrin repeat domain-containing protein [Wolbachia endosymbiont of Ctenocephalides felis wCfeJ]
MSQGTSLEVKDSNGNTLLHYASQNDHLEAVKYLIKKGASLKAKNKYGKTPLDLALQKNYISIIEFLKKTQLDLDEELLATVKGDDLNRVKALVSQGASLEAKDNSNNTPLHNACNNGHVKVVEYLIQEGASLKAKNKDGEAPLHVAVQHDGTLEVIEFILSRDLSGINDITNNGKTPLHLAIREDKPNTVQFLLRKGASIAVKDKNGKTSLDLAKQEDYTNIVEMIEKVQSDLDEELLTAVQDGNLNEAKGLVSRNANANVNTRDKYSWTPLHWAAYKGHLEVAEFLVKKGADVNAASENLYGSRPIHIAIENNNKNIIEFLLSKEVGVNDTDKQGYTPLHYAAWRGRLEVARFLIEKGSDINAADTSTAGKKPTHVAAENNSESVIEFLLEKGVSVDEADKNGWTPLHYAARFGQPEVAKFLIEKGADINAKDKNGGTPSNIAIDQKYDDVVEYLQQTQLGLDKQLLAAVQGGDFRKVKDLVNQGANVNAKGEDGETPLHFAVQEGNLDMVQFFLDKGADIEVKDRYEWTPLHFAASSDKFDVVKFLFDKNANIKARDIYGNMPLHVAARYSNKFEIVEFLLDKDANDINDVTNDCSTPLHAAVQGNKLSIVELLLDRGASIRIKDKYNRTPLNLAAKKGYVNIVQVIERMQLNLDEELLAAAESGDLNKIKSFITQGANLDAKDSNGSTPLHYASWNGNLSVVKHLVEKGANLKIKNLDNRTPLYDASLNGHLDIVRYLVEKGVDVNVADEENRTPLHCAVSEGHLGIVKYLINNGANFNAKNSDGKVPLDIAKVSEGRGKSAQRKCRYHHGGHDCYHGHLSSNQPEIAASSSTRPSLWINGLFDWVKSSIGGLLSSKPVGTSNTINSISQADAQIDVNGTIMLLDLLIRKVTGQKYISTEDQSISPPEAQGYALNITEEFKKVVEQAGLKSGVSMHRLNIDYMGMQKEITRKVMSGKFNEISGILKSYVEKACPSEEAGKLSPKKFDKFIAQFNKGLLNQPIEQILHNGDDRLEVDGGKQMSLEPQSYLSNASIQSHSKDKVSTCLSDVGVTKLGNTLSK